MFKLFAALAIAVSLAGCVWGTAQPAKTQLQIREFQTRAFDTRDQKLVLKALLNVLQDDGYQVKNINTELGFISATKESDLGGGSGGSIPIQIFGTSSEPARWRKTQVIEATGNVSEYGDGTRVRVSFTKKILDNMGDTMEVHQIEDAKFYQDFFIKVDKGIFLQKEKI